MNSMDYYNKMLENGGGGLMKFFKEMMIDNQ
jgi:hypothetical protein